MCHSLSFCLLIKFSGASWMEEDENIVDLIISGELEKLLPLKFKYLEFGRQTDFEKAVSPFVPYLTRAIMFDHAENKKLIAALYAIDAISKAKECFEKVNQNELVEIMKSNAKGRPSSAINENQHFNRDKTFEKEDTIGQLKLVAGSLADLVEQATILPIITTPILFADPIISNSLYSGTTGFLIAVTAILLDLPSYPIVRALARVSNAAAAKNLIVTLICNRPHHFNSIVETLLNELFSCSGDLNSNNNSFVNERVKLVLEAIIFLSPLVAEKFRFVVQGKLEGLRFNMNPVSLSSASLHSSGNKSDRITHGDSQFWIPSLLSSLMLKASIHSNDDIVSCINAIILTNQFIFVAEDQQLRQRLLKTLQQLKSLETANYISQSTAILKIYCALNKSINSVEALEVLDLIMRIATTVNKESQKRLIELGVSFLLACEGLSKLVENELIIKCFSVIEKTEVIADFLVLIGIFFHSNQARQVAVMVRDLLLINVSIHNDSLNFIGKLFIDHIMPENIIVSKISKLPIRENLNADVYDFIEISIMYYLLKGKLFRKNSIDVSDWVFRQIRASSLPIHPMMTLVIDELVTATVLLTSNSPVPSSVSASSSSVSSISSSSAALSLLCVKRFSEDQLLRVFGSTENLILSNDQFSRFSSYASDPSTPFRFNDTVNQNNIAAQILLLYYIVNYNGKLFQLLLSEHSKLTRSTTNVATNTLNTQTSTSATNPSSLSSSSTVQTTISNIESLTKSVYSSSFMEKLPIQMLIMHLISAPSQLYEHIYPPLLSLVVSQYPHHFQQEKLLAILQSNISSLDMLPNQNQANITPSFLFSNSTASLSSSASLKSNLVHIIKESASNPILAISLLREMANEQSQFFSIPLLSSVVNDVVDCILLLLVNYDYEFQNNELKQNGNSNGPVINYKLGKKVVRVSTEERKLLSDSFYRFWKRVGNFCGWDLGLLIVNTLSNRNRNSAPHQPIYSIHYTIPFPAFTHSDLISDPLLILRIDPSVFHNPSLTKLVLEIIDVYSIASRHYLRNRAQISPQGQTKTEEVNTLLFAQDSAICQILIELCLQNNENLDWVDLDLIRSMICDYMHQLFISQPLLIKLLHFQSYNTAAIPITVKLIPSMHLCLEFLIEMFGQNDREKQVFSIHLAAHLVKAYPIPFSLHVSRMVISLLQAATAAADSVPFLTHTIPLLELFCESFPLLIPEVASFLLDLCPSIDTMILADIHSNNPVTSAQMPTCCRDVQRSKEIAIYARNTFEKIAKILVH